MAQNNKRARHHVARTSSCWTGLVCMITLVLFLVGCASSSSSASRATPTPTVPTPTATATSTLVAPALAEPPTNCTNLATVHDPWPGNPQSMAPVVGGGPVWATLPPVVHIAPNGSPTYTPYGWSWKVIWEVGPSYPHPIALRATRVGDQAPLWFEFDGAPTTTPTLDPAHPSHPESKLGTGWREWGSYLYIPTAGCYQLQAVWPEGSWELTFAAGR
jgi:hypothetical protein